MVGVAFDFADMESGCGHHISQIVTADFDHEIGIGHSAPELGFNQITFEGRRELLKGIGDEKMGADMSAIPIAIMRAEDNLGPVHLQDVFDDLNTRIPMGAILFASFGVDAFKSIGAGGDEAKTEIIAGLLQFLKASGLP